MRKVAVLPGDGIGPEVVDAALKVLDALQEVYPSLRLEYVFGEAGLNCVERYGTNLPVETMELLKGTEACLKGPMTTPEGAGSPASVAVTIRKAFDLYVNMRPCYNLPKVPAIREGVDLVILRENTEGLYAGYEFEVSPGVGVAARIITSRASERIARFAFKLALRRRRHVTCVHKGNILKITDGIFKDAVYRVARDYPEVRLDEVHVDAMAMQLIKRPEDYDVIVTTNMFGDILSDEAAQVVGGIGVAAGANIGDSYAMFEPIHGSAPKYAGGNRANPIATIYAAGMMLDYLGETEAYRTLDRAVREVLKEGKTLTYDLGGSSGTREMAEAIAGKILNLI
ncbi:MAG: isocitrate/isopropylmalate dehydrogenase family protein [Candidatus Bathyarchaeia archaeon]